MNNKFVKPILLVAAGSFLAGGCTVREVRYQEPPPAPGVVVSSEVDVSGPPPAPLVDEVTVAPGPEFIWIPGVWAWHGRWEWEHGRWDRRPHPGAVWVPHRYVYRGGRHVYVRGGWR